MGNVLNIEIFAKDFTYLNSLQTFDYKFELSRYGKENLTKVNKNETYQRRSAIFYATDDEKLEDERNNYMKNMYLKYVEGQEKFFTK